jgi:hypothetical protein
MRERMRDMSVHELNVLAARLKQRNRDLLEEMQVAAEMIMLRAQQASAGATGAEGDGWTGDGR